MKNNFFKSSRNGNVLLVFFRKNHSPISLSSALTSKTLILSASSAISASYLVFTKIGGLSFISAISILSVSCPIEF